MSDLLQAIDDSGPDPLKVEAVVMERFIRPLMAEIAGLRAQVEEQKQEQAVITSAVMKR
jgi:hypothetical protein